MAGLGFSSRGGGSGSGKNMGIQFVKSSGSEDGGQSQANRSTSQSKGYAPQHSGSSYNNGRAGGLSAPPRFGAPAQGFGRGGSSGSSTQGFVRPGHEVGGRGGNSFYSSGNNRGGRDYAMPGSVNLSRGAPIPRARAAEPKMSAQEYQRAWRGEKDADLQKIRKLAWEVVALKTDRPNAIDKLHSAANRVPARVEFNTEPAFAGRGNNSFKCHVFIEGISVGSGQGAKIKDAKLNAYELALQRVLMPELRVVWLDPESRELQGSEKPFTTPPPKPSSVPLQKSSAQLPPSSGGGSKLGKNETKSSFSAHKESNMEATSIKRRFDEQRPLEDFIIVEPLVPIPDCTPAHTLRRSADFNHMLLEYEYSFHGEAARCVMKVEGQILADVNGGSKLGAKNRAAEQGLRKLKKFCWIIKTKQAVDADTKITKDEILNELDSQSDVIKEDNVGNKLLRKMGWSGGGVGKDGSGIAEPVSMKSVLNREGLGLGAAKGITEEYKRRVKEVIENYAASDNQQDLVFNCDFRLEERLIIHDECRRLNLRSKAKGKGVNRYLCVRRKRSANMLLDHIMSCGGETARYKLVPPEQGGNSDHPRMSSNNSQINGGSFGDGGMRNSPTPFQGGNPRTCDNDGSWGGRARGGFNNDNDRDTKEKKWAFGPPPSSLASSVNGNSDGGSNHRFNNNRQGLDPGQTNQDLRNCGQTFGTKRAPPSPPHASACGSGGAAFGNNSVRNGPPNNTNGWQMQQASGFSPGQQNNFRLNGPNAGSFNSADPSNYQQGNMMQNPNQAATFQGLQNAMMGAMQSVMASAGRFQNPMAMMQGNTNGGLQNLAMASMQMNQAANGLQRPPGMSSGGNVGQSGQWMHNMPHNAQRQQFGANLAPPQDWGQMAAKWAASQQGSGGGGGQGCNQGMGASGGR